MIGLITSSREHISVQRSGP